MTDELEFPIELRHPDGGSLLFTDLGILENHFFEVGVSHKGSRLFPSDFHLYVNGREYEWGRQCKVKEVITFRDEFYRLRTEIINHLRYVLDIERALYDEINIRHEDTILGHSDKGKAGRRREG